MKKKKELTMREHLSSIAKIKSPKKAAASRENGKKGGRKPKAADVDPNDPMAACNQGGWSK